MTTTRDVVRAGAFSPLEVKTYGQIPNVLDLPNLIKIQIDAFDWFKREGLRELLNEISPIQDFTGSKMDLIFGDYEFREPKHPMDECRERDLTYAAPLFVDVELRIKDSGEIKEQRLFFGDFPLMTDRGTFIINGAERVVVSQLVRSPGVYYTIETDAATGKRLCHAKLIPNRGAWLEFETSNRDVLYVKVDRKRKIPVTTLIRAIDVPGLLPGDKDNGRFAKYWAALESGEDRARDAALRELETELGTDERLLAMFEAVDTSDIHQFVPTTISKEPREPVVKDKHDALLEFYRTPAGRTLITKMPVVMRNSMTAVQGRMRAMQPKMQGLQTRLQSKLLAAAGPPPGGAEARASAGGPSRGRSRSRGAAGRGPAARGSSRTRRRRRGRRGPPRGARPRHRPSASAAGRRGGRAPSRASRPAGRGARPSGRPASPAGRRRGRPRAPRRGAPRATGGRSRASRRRRCASGPPSHRQRGWRSTPS